jgi:hypothetical protein
MMSSCASIERSVSVLVNSSSSPCISRVSVAMAWPASMTMS